MLFTFANGKVFIGRSLWGFGKKVMNSVKKAISLMPKLAPQICSINKNFSVISFSSGKTEDNLFTMIDNGMYDMDVKEGGAAVVDAYANATKGDDQNDNPQDDESRRDSGVDDKDLVIAGTENTLRKIGTHSKAWKHLLGIRMTVSWPFFALVPRHSTSRKSFVLDDQNSTTPKQRRRVHVPQ